MNAIDRRSLLAAAGLLTVSFAVPRAVPIAMAEDAGHAASREASDALANKVVAATDVDAYLAIDAQGHVTLFSGKVDLGTGVETALTQMVAEELDVPMAWVSVIQGDTLLTPDQAPTYGSNSIQKGGLQIRQACATARKALTDAASKRIGVPTNDLSIKDGVISAKTGQSVGYGALIGGKHFDLKLDPKAPTKNPDLYTIVGKPVARLDIPDKCTGGFTYMQDYKVPGMLHGRVVRPPAIGATLKSVDAASLKDIPGLVKIVRVANFLGVVCKGEWAAIKAARQLKAEWTTWDGLPEQAKLWDHVRHTKVFHDDVTQAKGDADAALAGAASAGRQDAEGVLRLRDPYPRLDRPVLRHRRMERWQADLLDGQPSDAQSRHAARRHEQGQAGGRALRLRRGLGLLRPQRPRGRRRRCHAARARSRRAGSGAVEPP